MSGTTFFTKQTLERLLSLSVVIALIVTSIRISAVPLAASSLSTLNIAALTQQTALAVVSTNNTVLFDKPAGDEVQTFESGAVVTAFGRSADNKWVAVRSERSATGWMKVSDLVLFGIETLAVLDPADALPGASEAKKPTPTAAPATATLAPTPVPTKAPPTATAKATTAQSASSVQPTRRPASSSLDSDVLAIVSGTGTTIANAPDGDGLETLDPGVALGVLGRSEDSQWLNVTTDSGTTGWVKVAEVVVFGVELLPVVDGSTAEVMAADTATSEPTPVIPAQAVASTGTKPTATPAPAVLASAPVESPSGVSVVVSTQGANLNIRTGPGTGFAIIGSTANGNSYAALGRDSAAAWVQVNLGSGRTGWLSAGFVTVTGGLSNLPVVATTSAPAAAVVQPAPAVTQSSTLQVSAPQASDQAVAQPASGSTGLTGKLVVSSGNGGMFYVFDLQTGELRPVTGGYDPAISPDSKQIAFARSGGENGIYVINLDGSNERKVYGGGELLGSPKWNADSSRIVFSRATSIESCRTPGFGICLPDVPEFNDLPIDNVVRFGLSRIRLNSDDDKFRDVAVVGSAIAPDWDNDNIIYRADRGFKITKDKPTVDVKDVTYDSGLQDPDIYGGRIVYQAKSGNRWEIMVMNDDGKGAVFLTRPETTLVQELPINLAPAWSPDGKSIVFLSNRAANNSAGAWAVWVMNADGSNQRRLPIDLKISYNYAQEQMVSWGK